MTDFSEALLLLYDIRWQSLRVRMLKQNKSDGGWTTEEGTRHNIHLLREYLSIFGHGSVGHFASLWRVINCLNAVRMGYSGQKLKGSSQDTLVKDYREGLSYEYKKCKEFFGVTSPFLPCDLADYRIMAKAELAKVSDMTVQAVYDNLQIRAKLHPGRPELEWYLELLCERLNIVYQKKI